ncbi:hypothetical protein EUA06_18270 [Nocardioides glacieisoli]|uniref:Uncharacterized protein n=1 Tax=Nocardioides glacieisoli TaxID=1168730 RepID=A0A4Q2RK74_9ACTN|nr:hypothetical protein [Nocardioides glacieisoli]RYB89047.1 hypothetical protein EUA06_18270 [Nocardioides glacieisoli]
MDPRRLLPALAAVASACVVATLAVTLLPPRDARPTGPARPVTSAPGVAASGPAAVLADWDQRRAAAWAEGDVEALRELYVDGSRTGAADARLLGHYRARGLAVTGLTTQVLALDVVGRTSSRLVLVVTDRVVGARAVGGSTPVALPEDRASTRRVVLRSEGGRWRVVEARDQPSAAASTLRTSSSSKS